MVFSSKKFLMSLLAVSLSALSAAGLSTPTTPPKNSDISLACELEFFELPRQDELPAGIKKDSYLFAKDFLYGLSKEVTTQKAQVLVRSLGDLVHEQIDGALQAGAVYKMLDLFDALSDDERVEVLKVAGNYIINFCNPVQKLKFYAKYLGIIRCFLIASLD